MFAESTHAEHLVVYHLARFTLIDPGLDGARLERRPDVETFEERDPERVRTVLGWIDAAKPAPSSAPLDARWGLIFFGPGGDRVRTVYLDANGTFGRIDDAPVTFASDSLVRHLRGAYGEDFVLS